ncbi:hypothetical protein ABZ570_10105 [Micromonospora sp. NPDC007271]|uniref:hypothetical protein n=1 Tax=Micromonospora sp. NPDC007271 TaxID=3154587 RepID=UPI0033EE9B30
MIATILRATARHRRTILAAGVVVAVVDAAAAALVPYGGQRLIPVLAVVGVLLSLGLASWLQRRPAMFVAQPDVPAFDGPVRAGPVYLALCVLLLAAEAVGKLLRSVGTSAALDSLLPAISMLFFAALFVVATWRGLGVQLRPEGVRVREVWGTLTVPWEALPVGQTHRPADQPTRLRLVCARPELVRRRGRVAKETLPTDNIDAQFLADVIRYYVLHPERRGAIGTEVEHRRLQDALGDQQR